MIEIIDLEKKYGTTNAVNKMNLSINSGEILGLLGPNGAGKSSTLRILTGYLQPTSGTIKVKGLDVKENELEIKKLIGYLPESAPLYPEMLVLDYLEYMANLRNISKKEIKTRIKELSDICGIKNVMHKSIDSLSKGYKQRVGLAQAMLNDPEILVLDEPTTGLDPNQIVEIRNIIKEIGKKKTVIFSTHILSEAEATCDRIVIVNGGNVVADGTPVELKQMMAGEIKIDLTLKNANENEISDFLNRIDGISSFKTNGLNGNEEVSIFATKDIRESLYLEIKKTKWILLSLSLEVKSLENIFRELTKEQSNENKIDN